MVLAFVVQNYTTVSTIKSYTYSNTLAFGQITFLA